GRYINASEAMWRLNEFNLSEKSHTVARLAVHFPDQQAIVYQYGQEEEAVARVATKQTTLTAWFELNKNDQDSHNYLYTDIPHYYTFNKSDDTEENVNGYPIYRRRATEPVQVGKYSIDNRWVVPYNPWLLKKFNAHINVEVCASVKSVKYLYKYVYKGHDVASVKIQKEGALDHDEILSFVEGRYVSAPEAMWHLNEFNLSHKSHTVVRLAVHLPQQQPIVYQAIERAALRKTTLTSWFELNKNDPSAHNISYSDIPQYYVFDKSTTNWKKRQRGGQNVIERLPLVSILDTERYYLRGYYCASLGPLVLMIF
ncbi:hypothetical protein AVEN_91062-1, partial [Araneus ventricosus]